MESQRPSGGAGPPGAVVLVVDDDQKLVDVIGRYLSVAGYTCLHAGSGDQALWQVLEHDPTAIVLDVMMPHPTGLEVCRHLRSTGYDGTIIVMTARDGPDERDAALRAGADHFLAKPFPLGALVRLIEPGAPA